MPAVTPHGAYAESTAVPADAVAPAPKNLDLVHAGSVQLAKKPGAFANGASITTRLSPLRKIHDRDALRLGDSQSRAARVQGRNGRRDLDDPVTAVCHL